MIDRSRRSKSLTALYAVGAIVAAGLPSSSTALGRHHHHNSDNDNNVHSPAEFHDSDSEIESSPNSSINTGNHHGMVSVTDFSSMDDMDDIRSMLDCAHVNPLPQPTSIPMMAPSPAAFQELVNLVPSPAPSPAVACDDAVSNARGHYSTSKAPCTFRFHTETEAQQEHEWVQYHTSDLCIADNTIGGGLTYKEYVTMWPDECVGDFPRCYSLKHHAHVVAPFLCAQRWPIPPGTTHLSVDCTVDKDHTMQSIHEEREKQATMEGQMSWKSSRQAHLTDWIMILVSCSVGIALLSQFVLQPILRHVSARRQNKSESKYHEIPHYNKHPASGGSDSDRDQGNRNSNSSRSGSRSDSISESTDARSASMNSVPIRTITSVSSNSNNGMRRNEVSVGMEEEFSTTSYHDGTHRHSSAGIDMRGASAGAAAIAIGADDDISNMSEYEVSRFLAQDGCHELPEGVEEVPTPVVFLQHFTETSPTAAAPSILNASTYVQPSLLPPMPSQPLPLTSAVAPRSTTTATSPSSTGMPFTMRTVSSLSDDATFHTRTVALVAANNNNNNVSAACEIATAAVAGEEPMTDDNDVPILFATPLPCGLPEAGEVVVLVP